jgi:two-component system response regulator ChvI
MPCFALSIAYLHLLEITDIECCITMIAAGYTMNTKLHEENLPSIRYRISADYGRVEVARSATSQRDDLFGSTINTCERINLMAQPNGIVIGEGLYQIVKSFSSNSFDYDYHFVAADNENLTDLEDKHNHPYLVYSLIIKNNNNNSNNYGIALNLVKPASETTPAVVVDINKHHQKYSAANIMLVDDDPDTLFTYKSFLSSCEGYTVEAFTDSNEALKHFAKVDPSYFDLVISDIRMPNLNGLQLYYRLTAINMAIKVLFVSALDAIEELVSVLPSINYNNIVRKPVEKEYFINKIRSVLLV